MSRWTWTLQEITAEMAGEVGGKAMGLARLAALGLPVPPAFAVAASFFEEVRSRAPDEPEVEALARRLPRELRDAIEAGLDALGPAANGYAVRSSAAEEDTGAASFAGVHESYLGVSRAHVLPALLRCWASGFTDRALLYRRRMGLPSDPASIRMAAVIQRMLRPSAAGVLFTRSPGNPESEMLIQAITGCGERLVRGEATPEEIRIPRRAGARGSAAPGAAVLPASRIEELAALALRAEAAWGSPLDIEWALEGDRLFLLQSRPITATQPAPRDVWDESELPPTDDTLWTRANLRELLPDLPSPLCLSMLARVDWIESNRRFGVTVEPGSELLRVIEGRPYFNLTLMGEMGARLGFPLSRLARSLGHGADLAGIPAAPSRPFAALLRHPVFAMRLLHIQASGGREILRFFDRVHEKVRGLRAEAVQSVSDARLLEILGEADGAGLDFLHSLQIAFSRVVSRTLVVEAMLPSGSDPDRFINAAVAAGEKNISVRQGLDLLLLARLARAEGRVVQYLLEGSDGYQGYEIELEGTDFLPAFRSYLADYGHRGIHESDPAMPLYSETPAFLLRAIGAIAADPRSPDPETTLRTQDAAASAAWNELRRVLSWPERLLPLRLLLLGRAVGRLKEALALRERTRFEGMRTHAEYRRFLKEAARRFVHRGLLPEAADLFFLRAEEIEAILGGKKSQEEIHAVLQRRKDEIEGFRQTPMPNLVRESEIPRLRERKVVAPGRRGLFQGLPVGPGRVEGTVIVLEGPHQMDRMRRGDILVAPAIDPSWIPLFTLASGLVVEMGGTLSHGSIIAREYGLPAVVNIPGITGALKTGDRVLLDGSAGLVRRLDEAD